MFNKSAGHGPLEISRPHTQTVRREVESKQLFGDGKELLIRHDGEYYTLRHTSKGKLILTK